jgi:hypothetical protein
MQLPPRKFSNLSTQKHGILDRVCACHGFASYIMRYENFHVIAGSKYTWFPQKSQELIAHHEVLHGHQLCFRCGSSERCGVTASSLYVPLVVCNPLTPSDTFPSTGSGTWSTVRQTVNFQSNAGLSDVTSEQIRCYTNGNTKAPQIQKVAAGGSVTFTASPNIFHPGPLQFYMAKVPSGQTAATWDGAGTVWFKTYAEPAIIANGQLSWASLSTSPAVPRRSGCR